MSQKFRYEVIELEWFGAEEPDVELQGQFDLDVVDLLSEAAQYCVQRVPGDLSATSFASIFIFRETRFVFLIRIIVVDNIHEGQRYLLKFPGRYRRKEVFEGSRESHEVKKEYVDLLEFVAGRQRDLWDGSIWKFGEVNGLMGPGRDHNAPR